MIHREKLFRERVRGFLAGFITTAAGLTVLDHTARGLPYTWLECVFLGCQTFTVIGFLFWPQGESYGR